MSNRQVGKTEIRDSQANAVPIRPQFTYRLTFTRVRKEEATVRLGRLRRSLCNEELATSSPIGRFTGSWAHARGGARCRRSKRSRRGGRGGPGHGIEIKKFQQVGLRGVARSQMGGAAQESVLYELDYRGVVHRR